jgi:D-mannonate dehydratase
MPARKNTLFRSGNMMFRRASILVCALLLLVHQEETAALNFQKITSSTRKIVSNNSVKIAAFAAAFVCICGAPDYSVAAESSSLETQLKQLQNIKATNQKRRIEAAELELQSKELLYPEGRLIGRGIVKLMPENGTYNFIIVWDFIRHLLHISVHKSNEVLNLLHCSR